MRTESEIKRTLEILENELFDKQEWMNIFSETIGDVNFSNPYSRNGAITILKWVLEITEW